MAWLALVAMVTRAVTGWVVMAAVTMAAAAVAARLVVWFWGALGLLDWVLRGWRNPRGLCGRRISTPELARFFAGSLLIYC